MMIEVFDLFDVCCCYGVLCRQLIMSEGGFETYTKADISFRLGYRQFRNSFLRDLVVHLIQAVTLVVFMPIDATLLVTGDKMMVAEGVALGAAVISCIILIYQYWLVFRREGLIGYLQLARDTMHATTEQVTEGSSERGCTSATILQAETLVLLAGVDDKTVEIYASMARRQICATCELKYPSLNCLVRIDYLTGLASMLIVIVLLANASHLNSAETSVLIIYLVLQAYCRFSVIFVLLLIAISPFICLGATIYFCCCGQGQTHAVLAIKPSKATRQNVLQSDGECTICLMSINVDDMVYASLPCSSKHVFHAGCLDKWSKVKMTCPTCRKQLPFRDDSIPSGSVPEVNPPQ